MQRFIRAKEFYQALGISKSLFYKKIKDGEINQGFLVGIRARAWTQEYVENVLKEMEQRQ